MIWLLANIHFDDGLLPYFLDYYEQRGVDQFGIIWHSDFVPGILSRNNIHLRHCLEPYISGPRDNELLNEMRQEYLGREDWYIPADLDEFHWYPGLKNFKEFIGAYDHVASYFVDRLAQDGKIHPLDSRRSLDDQFPLGSVITRDLCGGGCIDKVAFARGDCVVNSGHHFAHGILAPFRAQTHHFKWNASMWQWVGHREKLAEDVSGKEAKPFTEHYRANNRINIYDASLGVYIAPKIGI